ncbi:TPA: hypothetical protein ACJI8N_002476 [Enterococcus hirae]
MEKDKSLIIWNKNGSTMKFEKVTNFIEDWQRDQISFGYYGISIQVRSEAKFYTKNIAGYALEQEEA